MVSYRRGAGGYLFVTTILTLLFLTQPLLRGAYFYARIAQSPPGRTPFRTLCTLYVQTQKQRELVPRPLEVVTAVKSPRIPNLEAGYGTASRPCVC